MPHMPPASLLQVRAGKGIELLKITLKKIGKKGKVPFFTLFSALSNTKEMAINMKKSLSKKSLFDFNCKEAHLSLHACLYQIPLPRREKKAQFS